MPSLWAREAVEGSVTAAADTAEPGIVDDVAAEEYGCLATREALQ